MTSRTPSKPASEQLQTLSPQLQHRGKPRYLLVDLQRAQRSSLQLCSLLLSSLPSESCKQILTSFQEVLLQHSKLLDDHLISLSGQESKLPEEIPE